MSVMARRQLQYQIFSKRNVPLADFQNLETLLRQGVELSQAKRFQEAEPIFRQVLALQPRHTGAAYLLALCLYFTGQYQAALHLFQQLTGPASPLEPAQIQKLTELAYFARLEILRLEYWRDLRLKDSRKIARELKKRKWEADSWGGFHLHLMNGQGASWLAKYDLHWHQAPARILNRSGQITLQSEFRDVDETISTNLEVVRENAYELIPFQDLSVIEFGTSKRWITAQLVYREGRRETVQTPLAYRDSMAQSAWGIQEGVETLLTPTEEMPALTRAYGQKQFRSVASHIKISEIIRIEFA
jgi:tetratricopeptide (TPR) repeat protein